MLLLLLITLLIPNTYCKGFNKTEFVNRHNTFRNIHGSGALRIDNELSKKADLLAKEAASKGKLSAEDAAEAGENTYMKCSTFRVSLEADEVVDSW